MDEQDVVDDLTAFSGGHRDFSVGVRPVSPAAQRSGTESCRSGKEALVDRETDEVGTRLRALRHHPAASLAVQKPRSTNLPP
ncbi:hypothetical protein AB0L13_40890 [Saccharopolyspora shandongensis]|uniref:hypothetical protein n=1 Tax=Saccharopolyspora shandongensis TaxID=418495 RepID=UPI00342AA3DA